MEKIKLQNIYFQYDGTNTPILEDINLSVTAGEFICVLGPSGCGKSTLISILSSLQKPTSGHYYIDGNEVGSPGLERGVVFQHYSLFPWLTARENIVFGIRQSRKDISKKECNQVADVYLEKVGLADYGDYKPAHLSGGQQQRIAIARALAMNTEILLLDEPFGAIDTKNRHSLQKLISDLHEEEKKTFIFVTHDIEESIVLADRIVFMIPKQVYKIIDVNISKPKEYEQMRNETDFINLREELVDLFYRKHKNLSYDQMEAQI